MPHPLEWIVLRVLDDHGAIVGTGFVVADRLAVTCAHVVRDAGSARGQPLRVQPHLEVTDVVAQVMTEGWSDIEDVAFVWLPTEVGRPLPLSPAMHCDGHEFTALGYPKGSAVQSRRVSGSIAGEVPMPQRSRPALQLSGQETDEGLSGAPIYDRQSGRVVGMFTALLDVERPPDAPPLRIGYATTADTIVALRPDVLRLDAAPEEETSVPRELEPPYFVPRPAEIEWIKVLLTAADKVQPVAIVGMPGVGKSTLAASLALFIHGLFEKKATDVARSGDLIDDSGCEAKPSMDRGAPHPS